MQTFHLVAIFVPSYLHPKILNYIILTLNFVYMCIYIYLFVHHIFCHYCSYCSSSSHICSVPFMSLLFNLMIYKFFITDIHIYLYGNYLYITNVVNIASILPLPTLSKIEF